MTTHRAVVCKQIGKSVLEAIDQLSLERVPATPLEASEVRVAVHATGLNFYDLLTFVGKYQIKPPLPFVPCSEAAGIVLEVGEDVKSVRKGDHVVVIMSFGALTEEVVVPEVMVLKIPETLSFVQASATYVAFMTAYHGLVQRGNLKKGEYLLITGAAGGMGVMAVLLGKHLGAIVIAAASSEEKLQICAKLGADFTINYTTQDLKATVESITSGNGADVCYELVGGDIFDKCTRSMASEGRLLVVGFAGGRIPSIPANLPLIKGYSVVGVRAGASMALYPEKQKEVWSKMNQWIMEEHRFSPFIGHIFPAEKFKEAFKLIQNRKVIGKCVILWKSEAKL